MIVRTKSSTTFFFFFFITVTLFSEARLPKLISDEMGLQRDGKVKICGWAAEPNKIPNDITIVFKLHQK